MEFTYRFDTRGTIDGQPDKGQLYIGNPEARRYTGNDLPKDIDTTGFADWRIVMLGDTPVVLHVELITRSLSEFGIPEPYWTRAIDALKTKILP